MGHRHTTALVNQVIILQNMQWWCQSHRDRRYGRGFFSCRVLSGNITFKHVNLANPQFSLSIRSFYCIASVTYLFVHLLGTGKLSKEATPEYRDIGVLGQAGLHTVLRAKGNRPQYKYKQPPRCIRLALLKFSASPPHQISFL